MWLLELTSSVSVREIIRRALEVTKLGSRGGDILFVYLKPEVLAGDWQRVVSDVYSVVAECAPLADVRVTIARPEGEEVERLEGLIPDALVGGAAKNGTPTAVDSVGVASFENVAVGGTFDQMHAGHRLLLAVSGLVASSLLIVGITGEELLINKKFSEQIESFDSRKAGVIEFLTSMKPSLRLEITKLTDPSGPTVTRDALQAIVVSSETRRGADEINRQRVEQSGLAPLQIVEIALMFPPSADVKLSSTAFRAEKAKR